MWNCSAVLTRNGSLCNNTVSLVSKDSFLQRCVASTLKKRLLRTDVITIEELTSGAERFRNCSFNRISTVPCNQVFRNSKVTQITVKSLSVRQFHTSLAAKNIIDNKDVSQSEPNSTSRRITEINLGEIFEVEKESSDKVPSSHVPEHQELSYDSHSEHHHSKSRKLSHKEIEKKYPNPKQKMHDIYALVKNARPTEPIKYAFKKGTGNSTWICTLDVDWPEKHTITAQSNSKISASNAAAIQCLHWLESTGKLNKGVPIIYTSKDIKDILHRPVPLSVRADTLNAARIILDKYEDNIESIIRSHDNSLHIERARYTGDAIIDSVGTANPANRTEERLRRRNELLKLRYENRMKEGKYVDLPITEFREQIIHAIEQNNVVVIKGDTGCGKTTQVPQYIIDSFIERNQATDCNMIISQPRRISAISLAERVADERCEQVGDVVGYQVRLSQELPNTPAGMLFCTTGILLRKLQLNPTLEGCSHVIVDEAHERTINTDMLLVLLKRALERRPSLKVIVMSATINAELFQTYFSCGVVEVPGRTFPVEMNFMEDIDALGLRSPCRYDLSFQDADKENSGPSTDIVKMGELISFIAREKPPGAILVFLPGWAEISKMHKYLEDHSNLRKGETLIVPIHSKMSHFDQRKIFQKPPSHVRKIVLATDIAETGITVADVSYVVDSCTHRQMKWDEKRGFASIQNHWASQANINQRKGRAGRVKPGESYHFVSREKFAQLPEYPDPEVMRSSLDKTVLDAKTYSSERAADFLGAMPQPPRRSAIRHAVEHLIHLGALDIEENLTPLGKRIALFTMSPELSKAMVYSSIFQCLSPMITIGSLMAEESELFTGVLYEKNEIRNVKSIFHPTSDHVGLAWLFQQWLSINKESIPESRQFAIRSRIVHDKAYTLSKVRQINMEQMYHAKMVSNKELMDDMSARENEYAELDELCRGVLLSGLDRLLQRRDCDIRKGQLKKGIETFIMEDGSRATITPDSVNFKRKIWPSPYLTYVRRTHSEERRTSLIRETSIVSPLTVFLFNQGRMSGYVKKTTDSDLYDKEPEIVFKMHDRKNVNLVCDKSTADVLSQFRDVMWSVVRYLVANHGVNSTPNAELNQVEGFKIEMLQVLGKMLSEASEAIDNPHPPLTKPKKIQNRDDELD